MTVAGSSDLLSKEGVYASPAIIERRKRILRAARKLIGAVGIEDVSMGEIARESGVSKRTLYNAFESRDLLIASAIHESFIEYERNLVFNSAPATAERIVEHLSKVVTRNLEVRDYTQALLTIFFTSSQNGRVRGAIFEIAAHSHRPWIQRLERDGELQDWVTSAHLVEDLVRLRYAIGLDWSLGRIADREFAQKIISGVLSLVAGACKQRSREAIDRLLQTESGI